MGEAKQSILLTNSTSCRAAKQCKRPLTRGTRLGCQVTLLTGQHDRVKAESILKRQAVRAPPDLQPPQRRREPPDAVFKPVPEATRERVQRRERHVGELPVRREGRHAQVRQARARRRERGDAVLTKAHARQREPPQAGQRRERDKRRRGRHRQRRAREVKEATAAERAGAPAALERRERGQRRRRDERYF